MLEIESVNYILCLAPMSYVLNVQVNYLWWRFTFSSNLTQIPRCKLALDSTYFKVDGTCFKTKYIETCPQNFLPISLTIQSYYLTSLFLNTFCFTHLRFPPLTPYWPIWSGCTIATHLGWYNKTCGDILTNWGRSLIISNKNHQFDNC